MSQLARIGFFEGGGGGYLRKNVKGVLDLEKAREFLRLLNATTYIRKEKHGSI
jgi:hypothetical protein